MPLTHNSMLMRSQIPSKAALFLSHVHPSPHFYAQSADGYNPPNFILNQHRRCIIRSNGENISPSEVLTELNDMINKYFYMDFTFRKVVMDEEKDEIVLVIEVFCEDSV